MEWNDSMTLGYEPMDMVHREFVGCIANLQRCPDAEVPVMLDRMIEHLRVHFGEENEIMIRHEFPPRDCHIDEHAAVLRSAVEVRLCVARGDYAQARSFANALAKWFPGHADYMDAALAHWMVTRLHGGKPLVFRREAHVGVALGIDSYD
ncbi:hemerythrin [Paraburkholderia sp. LEh10]|uniref:bacteriohemerythrin n=1 Tax=Paraburkholderia sp. LEh10 TaxID=2821353 RepID=UPI001AE996C4|nr:hemerythrin domain-containing protein [Paraburkholderia sp. LEh10]MBP0594274.1 hemerythrin [Paraburkholderia sp. LEh10]